MVIQKKEMWRNIWRMQVENARESEDEEFGRERNRVFPISVGVEIKVPQTQTKSKNLVSIFKSFKPKFESNF